ncbi:DUF2017 domain-containing protein [Streptomyces xiamenensis]
MAGYFERTGGADGGAAVALDEIEISILRSLAVQLVELIGPGTRAESVGDELDALFAEGPSEPPTDPALARLFPDAYHGPDDGDQDERSREHSAEFRRFTEDDLRAGKRENLLMVIRALDGLSGQENGPGGAVLTLAPNESQAWLGALNDLRLAIGVRLGISKDDDSDRLFSLPDDNPDKPLVMAYLWLGGLQESLIATLLP